MSETDTEAGPAPTELATAAAEAIRSLARATEPTQNRLQDAGDAFTVIGSLVALMEDLPQSVKNIETFLNGLASEGRLTTDTSGPDLADAQFQIQGASYEVTAAAMLLRGALDRAHEVLTHIEQKG